MHIGDTLRLSVADAPAGVTLLDDLEETVLATVTQPTRVEEPEVRSPRAKRAPRVPPRARSPPARPAQATTLPASGAGGEPGTAEG